LKSAALLLLLAACTRDESLLPKGKGEGPECPQRYADPRGRFSFCAAAGAKVSLTTSNDERSGVLDYVYYAPNEGSTFTVVATSGPYDFRGDDDVTFAGRAARHERIQRHEHSPASSEILEDHRHVYREAEGHDVTVERWGVTMPSGGVIVVSAKTREDTTAEAKLELQRALASFRFSSPE
jgi:hypothetical protein